MQQSSANETFHKHQFHQSFKQWIRNHVSKVTKPVGHLLKIERNRGKGKTASPAVGTATSLLWRVPPGSVRFEAELLL